MRWLVKIYDEQGFLCGMQFCRTTARAYRLAREGSFSGFAVAKLSLEDSEDRYRMVWWMNGDRLFFPRIDF